MGEDTVDVVALLQTCCRATMTGEITHSPLPQGLSDPSGLLPHTRTTPCPLADIRPLMKVVVMRVVKQVVLGRTVCPCASLKEQTCSSCWQSRSTFTHRHTSGTAAFWRQWTQSHHLWMWLPLRR